ncbi:SLC13 family permease [Streptomyces sp. NPDC059786]|uniref:GntT/GntP/DsdX family permease n=1 Tax=Streptomyces sp. NPDC059786 TaxID=3346946 RepID=UPI00364726EC
MHSSLYILGSGIAAVALLVFLIAKVKLHPFLGLLISTLLLGLANGLGPTKTVDTITENFGGTLSTTGIVIALGTVLGGLLLRSGGADRIADVLVGNRSKAWMPISIGIAAVIIGLPNLFEVTFVLLVPLVYSVARRFRVDMLAVGIPMAAGLMTAHALLPPGPAPVLAADAYDANLGVTILYGSLVGIPVLLVGALAFPRLIARWGITSQGGALESLGHPEANGGSSGPKGDGTGSKGDGTGPKGDGGSEGGTGGAPAGDNGGGVAVATRPATASTVRGVPSLAACLTTVLVAPVMMIVGTLLPDALPEHGWYSPVLDAVGSPVIALLVSALFAYYTLGIRLGMTGSGLLADTKKGLTPVISLLLIIGAGGALKGMLSAIGLSDIIADSAQHWSISPVLFAWLIAAIFRIALGSGTVAVAAATGIIAPLLAQQSSTPAELIVLATCTGAMIFSHVSDGAFWMFKEYFGLTVPQTLKTWSLLVTVQAVTGLVCILAVDAVVQVL